MGNKIRETLEKVAKALGVTANAIENFSEEGVFNYFNSFTDNAINNGTVGSSLHNCTFNPIDKIVKLYDEKVALMERLLASEKEKVEMLERVLKERG